MLAKRICMAGRNRTCVQQSSPTVLASSDQWAQLPIGVYKSSWVILFSPLLKAGSPRAGCSAHVQSEFAHLQGRRLCNLSGQPVPACGHICNKKKDFFLMFRKSPQPLKDSKQH